MDDPLKCLSSEEKLLTSLCRLSFNAYHRAEISLLIKEVKNWDHFINLANYHGIIALCYRNIIDTLNSKSIPAKNLEILKIAYLKSMVYNAFLYKQLKEITSLAKKENIKIVILKGLALENTVYGNQGIRQISDIDILVEKDNAIQLRKLLLDNGYSSLPLISSLHKNILPYLKNHLPAMEKSGVSIEIHTNLFDQKGSSLTDKLFNTAYKISEDDIDIFYPQLQILFLYLVQHIVQHEKILSLQLKSFTDLVVLLALNPDQILNKQLFDIAKETGLTDALAEKLRILELFWNFSFPEWVYESISMSDNKKIIEKFVSFIRKGNNYSGEEEIVFLSKPLKKIPGVFNKILFITGYIFPSMSYMKYKYATKTGFYTILYYPMRWFDIFSLLIKSRQFLHHPL